MPKRALLAALAAALMAAAPAQAAKTCAEPGVDWERATPAEAGMDAAKLQDAMDYGTQEASYAVRVYRHGCLVGEDRNAAVNRTQTYESWSMAKSVTAMVFGRAMTMKKISPDDPVGALVPEADQPHGKITMENLLTMTSGLRWNGFRDYNIFTMRDRIRDALTLETVKAPGTYFEYAQSAVSLLAEATGRAVGADFEEFGQRELFDVLGIRPENWEWKRDQEGHVLAFMGVNMRPDDFGRLGDLMRRGGVWNGRRLLSKEFMTRAIAPSATNGCYGWLIWVNSAQPCIGPTVTERGVSNSRDYPDLPADMYRFSGLFGQLVTVFPTEGIVVVRTGQDPGLVPAGGQGWEHELYTRVLGAITDQQRSAPGEAPRVNDERESADYGFHTAFREPDEYSKGQNPPPLPPAGPRRARAVVIGPSTTRMRAPGTVGVRLWCPPRHPAGTSACEGTATLEGATGPRRFSIPAGSHGTVRFRLGAKMVRRVKRHATAMTVSAVSSDDGGGTATADRVTVRRR